ncbi:MAG: Crp/Fnr family transcriptional regulator [Erythrobacter sp.]
MEDLLAKYGTLAPLQPEEELALRSLAAVTRDYPAGADLVAGEYDEPDHLYIVKKGRLFASSDLPNGQRAITRLYFEGDIVGTANIPFEHATQSITVQSPSTLYTFPRHKLIDAFQRLPRVAAIFYTFAALENAVLNDRLVSIGRTRGKSRLASLLMEIASRQHLYGEANAKTVSLCLTQAQIGDAIGLTEVQVNRLFRALHEDGIIDASGGIVEIIDHGRLCDIGHFHDRYQDLDLDWFDEEIGRYEQTA